MVGGLWLGGRAGEPLLAGGLTDRVDDMPPVTGANQQIVGAARGRAAP